MDKAQTIHVFWNGFGWPAYDESTVPEDAQYPYITYDVVEDELGQPVSMYASLWDRSTSWARVSNMATLIANTINHLHPPAIAFDDGRVYITKGTPFAQRMTYPDDMTRRVYINITAEYFSAS